MAANAAACAMASETNAASAAKLPAAAFMTAAMRDSANSASILPAALAPGLRLLAPVSELSSRSLVMSCLRWVIRAGPAGKMPATANPASAFAPGRAAAADARRLALVLEHAQLPSPLSGNVSARRSAPR